MNEIPLFPLNTVLFPGMPINLHIFEPRYKEMIRYCLETQSPFGVVLIREGDEALGPLADPYPIGCTAQITHMEQLENGHLDVFAVGLERFHIHGLSYDQPYLTGMIEVLPFEMDHDSQHLIQAGTRLRPLVERYLAVLSEAAEEVEFDSTQLPNDPMALAYLAATVVQIPAAQKQELLATGEATELLADIRTIYQREVPLLRAILQHSPHDEMGMFSLN